MKGALVNILALGILCALIWFGGQYFEVAVQWRIAGILGALALWLLIFLWQRIQAIRTARLIEARLREQAMDQIANSRPAERSRPASGARPRWPSCPGTLSSARPARGRAPRCRPPGSSSPRWARA